MFSLTLQTADGFRGASMEYVDNLMATEEFRNMLEGMQQNVKLFAPFIFI